ncbi:Bone morphogenetic protein receptor type-2 [Eumeta japonica]|uniref:Serine/threonine-protein kinase receptor n=1 Tax=Eumeta variegata TaxID=151549 RepID=A0A4C1YA56_EUMVA|nr:Bone morphogenetic protein receptor type-2 [Eumeta japonica]
MMDDILSHKVTPLMKCIVLLLFIFTAKVLTSRPQDDNGTSRNSIHHQKSNTYVRTFTKYHHRRVTPPEGNEHWPLIQDHTDPSKVIKKRGVQNENSEEISLDLSDKFGVNNFVNSLEKNVINHSKTETTQKNVVERKRPKVKAAIVVTDPPTTAGPKKYCLYKTNKVEISVTPGYDDEKNQQQMIENDDFVVPGPLSEMVLNGEQVQVEQCTDGRASCYTLLHEDSQGNLTVLGQGCWRYSQKAGSMGACDQCVRVTAKLPDTRFCCCTRDYCNADYGKSGENQKGLCQVNTAGVVELPIEAFPGPIDNYTATPIAESTVHEATNQPNVSHIIAFLLLAVGVLLILTAILKKIFCKRVPIDKEEVSEGLDIEKADIMGSGPDALATGLSCVDNLTLIEHIGQGKFGSVWRGTLGSTSVAVKLYSSPSTWQKEAAIYAMPHLSHQNLLKYYGSDTRPTLTDGGRDHLIVLEMCVATLRATIERSPLTWQQFASLSHGLASALAHLHSVGSSKPCVVHRDVNSNNVLIAPDGTARLADLGLAQVVYQKSQPAHRRVTEAGTLRYLAPEALEGALDLSGARAALCAVDVFALGLVLWEMLWRTSGAHAGPTPPYALPYSHQGLTDRPTLAQMQGDPCAWIHGSISLSYSRGPVPEARVLRLAADTCDECWDHDAEARLTAVCVEERMNELRQLLRAPPPRTHDNNLHPDRHDATTPTSQETDKNSNCIVSQSCDVTTPLLYAQPHIGRNACIERNTHVTPISHTVELVHKSLKDITVHPPPETRRQKNVEPCLSVARTSRRQTFSDFENSDRLNEIRSYQRPLDYVPNDVTLHENQKPTPKQTNLMQDVRIEKPKWGIKSFFERKLNRSQKHDTEVKLVPDNSCKDKQNTATKTSIVNEKQCNTHNRPANLVLDRESYNFEAPCTLSPPNITLSPNMMIESERNKTETKVFGFKEMPLQNCDQESSKSARNSQIFAVIVPKAKPTDSYSSNVTEAKNKGSSESINRKSVRTSMSSQSLYRSGNSESEDSTLKKRLSCDNKIISDPSPSGRSSRASINLELQYINPERNGSFDNSDCSSSEDEHLMLLSENGVSKITMHTVPKNENNDKKNRNEVLKESTQKDYFANKHSKYKNLDNEYSYPNDKENLLNGFTGDNPVYLAAMNGEINTDEVKHPAQETKPKSPKPNLRNLAIRRQHSLEQVSEIFSSTADVSLQNPAGRVKTPGDLPVAIRKARRDRALQKGKASETNRLSLYDDRMMFGNSL